MAYQKIDGVRVWGTPDEGALAQAIMCAETGHVVQTLLMADHHKGYSQPIGVFIGDHPVPSSTCPHTINENRGRIKRMANNGSLCEKFSRIIGGQPGFAGGKCVSTINRDPSMLVSRT